MVVDLISTGRPSSAASPDALSGSGVAPVMAQKSSSALSPARAMPVNCGTVGILDNVPGRAESEPHWDTTGVQHVGRRVAARSGQVRRPRPVFQLSPRPQPHALAAIGTQIPMPFGPNLRRCGQRSDGRSTRTLPICDCCRSHSSLSRPRVGERFGDSGLVGDRVRWVSRRRIRFAKSGRPRLAPPDARDRQEGAGGGASAAPEPIARPRRRSWAPASVKGSGSS